MVLPLAAALLAAANVSLADKVIRKDGIERTGRIVAENAHAVILEIGRHGAMARLAIPLKDIQAVVREDNKVEKPALKPGPTSTPAGRGEPGYYPIPIIGEIGEEVKAKTLALALADARDKLPDYVVLYIDSPGGSVEETRQVLAALGEAQDLNMVALVRQALSAAAIVALSCPDIYMTPSATIGGAVPYRLGPKGTPKAVEEKFQSAIRAQFRAAAEMGGHPAALVEAMMDPNVQLFLVEADGTKTLAKEGKGKLIKAKGKVLTLTPKEAMACNLVKGTTRNLLSLHRAMEIKAWRRVRGTGWRLMMGQAALARRKQERQERRQARAEGLKAVQPELKKIDGQLVKVRADLRLAESEMMLLKGQYDRELAAIHDAYKGDRKRAAALGAVGRLRDRENLLRSAAVTRDNKLMSLNQRFEPQVRSLKLRLQRLHQTQGQLEARRRKVQMEVRAAKRE